MPPDLKSKLKKRINSKAFHKRLHLVIHQECVDLSQTPLKKILPPKQFSKLLSSYHGEMFDEKILQELVLKFVLALQLYAKKNQLKIRDLLSFDLELQTLDKIFKKDFVPFFREQSEKILDLDFFKNLWGELIYLTISNFNKKVNPLFGGVTQILFENKVKSFIDLFIPVLHEKAKEYILSKKNQEKLMQSLNVILETVLDFDCETLTKHLGNKVELKKHLKKIKFQAVLGQVHLDLVQLAYESMGDQCLTSLSLANEESIESLSDILTDALIKRLKNKNVFDFLSEELLLLTE